MSNDTLLVLADSDDPQIDRLKNSLAGLQIVVGNTPEAFETAARFNAKQGLLYSVWAWCHWKNGNNDRALQILARGDKEMESKDERLKQNLLNVQNGKKMKMKGYAEQWYQFHLEKPPAVKQQVRFR